MPQLSKSVTDFINTVLEQIKYKKVHSTIAEELNNHIFEQAQDYIADGMEEEEAFSKAVNQMGNPIEIGKRLHKTHKPKTEWSIIALLAVIVVYGLYIISMYTSVFRNSQMLNKQLLFAVAGVCVLIVLYFFDYTKLEECSIPVYFITCALWFLQIMWGSELQGRSYIYIFGFGFNPSLILIPVLLLCYSGLIKKWCDGTLQNMLKLIAASALPLVLMLIEPYLINMLITGAGFLAMLTFGIFGRNFKGNRKKTLLIIYGALLGVAALLFIHIIGFHPYRVSRIATFFNPQSDPQGAGWMYTMLDNILDSAKLISFNESFVNSIMDFNSPFPGASSEYILTFVIGSLGWLFGIIMIVLLGALILRLFVASSKVRNEYGKYLCVGICCVFSLQVIVNVLMCLRLFPTFSVSLPFFSYGGASYLLNMALMGLLLGVYRRKDIIKVREM